LGLSVNHPLAVPSYATLANAPCRPSVIGTTTTSIGCLPAGQGKRAAVRGSDGRLAGAPGGAGIGNEGHSVLPVRVLGAALASGTR
jgi:hypothetical protein